MEVTASLSSWTGFFPQQSAHLKLMCAFGLIFPSSAAENTAKSFLVASPLSYSHLFIHPYVHLFFWFPICRIPDYLFSSAISSYVGVYNAVIVQHLYCEWIFSAASWAETQMKLLAVIWMRSTCMTCRASQNIPSNSSSMVRMLFQNSVTMITMPQHLSISRWGNIIKWMVEVGEMEHSCKWLQQGWTQKLL